MKRPSPLVKRTSADLKMPLPKRTNWKVSSNELRHIPSFYPLEHSSKVIQDTPSNVASRLSDACRLLSIHANFNDELATAELITEEHVEIHLTLWRGDAKPSTPDETAAAVSDDGDSDTNVARAASSTPEVTSGGDIKATIIEAQRRKGCAVTYHRYCRNLFDAAQGLFEPSSSASERQLRKVEVEKKEDNEEENSLLAIEIAASLLKKDRMDARRLGMESLMLLTDPSKTGIETALLASQIVLFGSVQEESGNEADFIPDELGIREAILSLVQFGKLGEYCEFDSDDEGDDNVTGIEGEFNEVLHNLALAVLANALEVLEVHGNAMVKTQEEKPSANTFLEESQEISKRELLSSLLGVLGKAETKPHDACLSARSLRSLFQASKEAKRRAKELKAKQIVLTALDVGRRSHVKLENETENVMKELEKVDQEVEGVDQAQNDDDSSDEEEQ